MTVRVFLESKTSSWSEEIATYTCEDYDEVCIIARELDPDTASAISIAEDTLRKSQ